MLKVQRAGTINKKNVIQKYIFALTLTCDPYYSNLKQKNCRQHDHPSLMCEDIDAHKNTDLKTQVILLVQFIQKIRAVELSYIKSHLSY